MTAGDDSEPDRVHRWKPSRRQTLALGTGMMGSLAGCSELTENISGDSSDSTPTEEPSLAETVEASAEYSFEEVSLGLNIGRLDADVLSGTLRLYSAPNLNPDDETVIAETEIEQSEQVATHTLSPDWSLGYAQQLHFTIEMHSPESAKEEEVYKTGNMIVPFNNEATGEEMVRVMGTREPPKHWAGGLEEDPSYKAQFWFDSPDDAFNTPDVPEGEYDSEWYPYRDITVTALVKYPSYENIVEREERNDAGQLTGYYHVPLTDVVAFSFTIGQWEMLEGFRWNSRATQKLEAGQREHKNSSDAVDAIDDYQDLESIMETTLSKMQTDGAAQPELYAEYYDSRHTETDYFQCVTNPLKAGAGRPVTYRIANTIEGALDNPSFNTQEYTEFQKAIVLQVFVGSKPYEFAAGGYVQMPEETINRWFLEAKGESSGGSANCQDGTVLYAGIASHLLNSSPCYLGTEAGGISHATSGLLDLRLPDKPYEVWPDDHPSPNAEAAYTEDTEYGTVSMVETIYPDPIIGWKLLNASDVELASYLSNSSVQSHIPLTDDYEPDQSGSVQTGVDDPEIPWEFHENNNTISDVNDL
jgi:hypothetical protein